MSIIGYKDQSCLVFEKSNGETLKYDFKDKSYRYKDIYGREKRISSGQNFFRKIQARDIANSFRDEAYSKFIKLILDEERRCKNVATLLDRIAGYAHLEGYLVLGIRFREYGSYHPTKPVNQFSKEVISFMKDLSGIYDRAENRYGKELNISSWEAANGEDLTNLVTYVRANFTDDYEAYEMVKDIVETYWGRYKTLISPIGEIVRINAYDTRQGLGCEYKALFRYIVRIVRQEALTLGNVIQYYTDYLTQAGKMSELRYLAKYRQAHPNASQEELASVRKVGYNRIEKYPRYLSTQHDIVAKNYRCLALKVDSELFTAAVNPNLEYAWGKYKVLMPKSAEEVKQEGAALNHCVAGYIDRILNGSTQIAFLREDEKESLVTLEIRAGAIQQARGYNNRDVTDEERKWLQTYAKQRDLKYGYNAY